MNNEYFMGIVDDLRFLATYIHDEMNELRADDVMRNAAAVIEHLMDEIHDIKTGEK